MAGKTERLYIRITPEVKARLAEAAASKNRSITNYVADVLLAEGGAPERSFRGFGTFIASFFLRSLSCFTPHQQQKIAASGISLPHCLHSISLFPPV